MSRYITSKKYRSYYKGLHPSHGLKNVPKLDFTGQFYIVLEKREDKNIGHYMLLIKLANGDSPVYGLFDSYGLPVSKNISDFLNRTEYIEDNDNYTYTLIKTSNDFQSMSTNVCGAYVLFFLDNLFKGVNKPTLAMFSNLAKKFTRDPSNNNINLLKEHFQKLNI